jgi:sugar phosphate isomerase/epimerase
MQLGIFAKTFPGSDAATVLSAARDAGYATVQFNMSCAGLPSLPDRVDAATIEGIRTARAATGVAIAAISGTYNMIHPRDAFRRDGMRRLATIVDVARDLGVPLVTLCTGSRDPDDQWRHHPGNDDPSAWRDLLAEMEQAVTLAEAAGVTLGIEPELANVVSSARHARDLLDAMRSPRLAIVLDPANLFEIAGAEERRRAIAEAIDLLGPDIAMAHAKDRAADGSFVAAGKGVIDFADFVGRLRRTGFDGPLVTHGLSAAEAPAVAAYLRSVLEPRHA